MMEAYDKTEAVALILSRMFPEEYRVLPREMLEPLISQCVDADFDYMLDRDVLRPDGSMGNRFYNKENARKHILSTLYQRNAFTKDHYDDLYMLVDDYLDFNHSYLELKGIPYPVDHRLDQW